MTKEIAEQACEDSIINEGEIMIMTIVGVLVVLWLLGLLVHIGGGIIHFLLVVAAIVFLYDLLVGRKRKI